MRFAIIREIMSYKKVTSSTGSFFLVQLNHSFVQPNWYIFCSESALTLYHPTFQSRCHIKFVTIQHRTSFLGCGCSSNAYLTQWRVGKKGILSIKESNPISVAARNENLLIQDYLNFHLTIKIWVSSKPPENYRVNPELSTETNLLMLDLIKKYFLKW